MLSKSKYIKGLQCEKRLWLDKHQPQLKDPISASQEALFAQGSDVGELAQQLFPNGKDATPDYSRRDGIAIGLAQTKQWIAEGADVIYEAAVSAGGVYAAMDILVREGNSWRAIEVKSSTGVKDYHINDAAIQYFAFKQAGIELVDIELMYINNEYVRDGALELDKLFARESLLDHIVSLQAAIPERMAQMMRVLKSPTEPERNIGPHCYDPFACDFIGHCWAHVPQPNVLDIARIGSKGWDLMDQGIMALDEIPVDAPLNEKQWNQVNGHKTGVEVWDKPAIQSFLSEWEYPLYFFDFETIGPAVPLFDDTRPYQQYPFQYSLHIIREPGAEPEHKEYLAEPNAGDPRPMLMVNMIKDLGQSGSIVTYNMGFEKGKIKDLAISFPEYAKTLLALNDRVVDLIVPFRSHWCYLPAMNGSASIKTVLPALTDLSYDALEIKEGGTASSTWQAIAEGKFEGNQEATLNALREYCKLDTWAMVEVWWVLEERCGK